MKKGDKLICKKRFDQFENYFCVFAKDDSSFEVDQTYLVNQIHVSNNNDGSLNHTTISVSCGFLITEGHGTRQSPYKNREENTFFLLENKEHRNQGKNTMPYLYDYFYTPREIRKLKLLKTQRNQKFEKLGWL
jgi:hypothetical protein